MNIHIVTSEQERAAVFALRMEVFVEEQQVPPEIELDAEDAHAVHIIAVDRGGAVGCARLLREAGEAHIGRLAVKKSHRKKGVGSAICRYIIAKCREQGCTRIWLNSQIQAVPFYQKLGFVPCGEPFMEAGIEHVEMEIREYL